MALVLPPTKVTLADLAPVLGQEGRSPGAQVDEQQRRQALARDSRRRQCVGEVLAVARVRRRP